jgi:hypothetical protein
VAARPPADARLRRGAGLGPGARRGRGMAGRAGCAGNRPAVAGDDLGTPMALEA